MGRAIPTALALVAIVVTVAVLLHVRSRGEDRPMSRHSPQTAQAAAGTPRYDQARVDAQRLPVKGREPNSEFARYRFGEAWSDDVNVEFGLDGC